MGKPSVTQVQKPNDEQHANLMAWRAEALERMPYMATILLALRPLNAPGLATFACDPFYRLYIDFDVVTEWGPRTCAEALLHECFHLFAHDAERATEHGVKDSGRSDYNIAADCANNDDLVDAGCTGLAERGVLPSDIGAPNYQTAETYFEHMKATGQTSNSPNGENNGSGGEGSDTNDGASNDWAGCGSASGGKKAPGELDEDNDANGAAPAANETERRINDIATSADIRDYASRHPGKMPRGLVERAEQILKPSELSWRKILSASVRRAVASRLGDFDVSYSRRNRRHPSRAFGSGRMIQPGMESPIPRLAVVRDTSGSMMPDDLATVTSEVEGIARQIGIRGDDLIVLDVDVVVAAKRKYRRARDLEEVAGRGGTDMANGIYAAAALRPSPSAIVVLTDGATGWPSEQLRIPVVACIVGGGSTHGVPKWIKAVSVPEGAK